ncbi:MAG: SRPBCC family protein [Woeseiaceae bacterium]
MSPARKILYGIGAIVLLVIAIGVFLPSTGHVERETTIDAHPATVFALVNDVHPMLEWSPWIAADRQSTLAFSGPDMGVNAVVRWNGAADGQGSLRIVESVPFERVTGNLVLDGKEALSSFGLTRSDGGTGVVWEFDIDFGNDLIGRYSGLFLERAIGGDYEQGLVNLKTMAESLPRADFSDAQIERMVVDPIDIAYLTTTSQPDAAAISEAMGEAYFNILQFMDRNGLEEAGPPLSINRSFSGSELLFDAAIPVRGITADTPRSADGVKLGQTRGGTVIRASHTGSYRHLGRTHEKISAYLAAHGIERNGDAWESYVSDPTQTAEPELLTYIYYPVKER